MSAPDIKSQSMRDGKERQSSEFPPDTKLPENSQQNLDARLDHAIEETFPTSDPISVTITKGPEPEPPDQAAGVSTPSGTQAQQEQDSAEKMFWIRSEKPCTTCQGKRLAQPVGCTAEASATSDTPANTTRRQSDTFARAPKP